MIDVHQNAALSESFEGDRSRVIGNRCKVQNQHLQEISLLKLHESSVTMSVFCGFFWIQKMEKNLTSAFSKN